jgi:hypothetical protein
MIYLDVCTVFYSGILGEEAAVIVTIQEMTDLATKMFFNSLSCHAGKLLEKVCNNAWLPLCKITWQDYTVL